jgi:diguanylate cyclase
MDDEANRHLRSTKDGSPVRHRMRVAELTAHVAMLREASANMPEAGRSGESALRDPLTGLANRAGFDFALANMVASAEQSSSVLTLAMLDVDESISDPHSHLVGDQVLLRIADWLRGSLRQDDVIARHDGEQFAVLVNIDLKQAEARFASMLANMAVRPLDDDENGFPQESVRFTVSCGLAQLTDGDTAEDLLSRADQALYDAKHKGGNCVCARKVSRLARLLSR